ncbi:SusC/RagA family TonB-linked outer membrane protein [Chondrinema litorale]|uniref:SusC/RagA family TonB-linked outer membrane protein n=1 Tax=Chondrinema litorale TaxID=2994555 RepID=UPI002543A3FC|nr:SusC/RagA family TonB-linked outer membrane protein [Chondrinema litorale]UZR96922.1 SusC/RagA family TonB-linked outer membrane protein [Chondrinema litorale]
MKIVINYKKRLIMLGLMGLIVFFNAEVMAQANYVIMGKITDQGSGDPLIGATLQLEGTDVGTISNLDGEFTISTNVDPGEYKLIVRSIGYVSQTLPVSLGAQTKITIDVPLKADILSLDEVVVTGSTVATSKKQLGNAISTVQSKDLENTGAVAIDQALSGKISGALIQQNSGDPAGGISVRLRGPSTITGSSDPLYIVDGVIVSNSSNELIDLGGTTQNRLVDINPNDIERIEVIKGAAAAAIYGSRASNGVVQIFTKRGQSGKPKISLSTSFRMNELRKKIDYNQSPVDWVNATDYADLSTESVTRYDLQEEIFGKGYGSENFISINGGTDKTKYFISGSYLNNGGIVKNSSFERYGARLNLNQYVNDWLTLNLGLNYTNSTSQDIPNGGLVEYYGALTGFIFADNTIDPSPDEYGVYPGNSLFSNPAEVVANYQFGQKTNRVITNLGLTANPIDNMTITYQLGIDYYNQSGKGYLPIGNTSNAYGGGYATRGDANVFQYNSDLNLSYDFNISPDIRSTSVIGGTWQNQTLESISLTAQDLVPAAQVSSAGTIIGQSDYRSEVSYWGAFAQQTFGFKEKFFLTGALRLDGASVFGTDERNQVYAKASASYLISSEDFWQSTFGATIPTFKLRASWGQAGNLTALGAFDRFSNYNAVSINSTSGVVPATVLGNSDLRPERQEEFEIGIDVGLLNDRLGFELTYYNQDVEDLLLERELASSSGYTTRYENVGALTNKGIELLVRASVIKTKDFNWDLTATYSSNDNTVNKVVGESITLPNSFSASYVIPGQSIGVFKGGFYERDEDGNIVYGTDGLPSAGTAEDGTSSKILGDPNPDWFGSLINEFSYKKLGLRVQFDAVQGYDVFDWNKRVINRFGGGTSSEAELNGDLPKGFSRATYSIYEEFITDGSFVKLREIALSYYINPKSDIIETVKFTLVGRNLLSFDNYTSWDPEINTTGQSNGVRGFDFAGVPIPRTYQFGVNVTF